MRRTRIASPLERRVPLRVESSSGGLHATVDFDDEPPRGADEVCTAAARRRRAHGEGSDRIWLLSAVTQ